MTLNDDEKPRLSKKDVILNSIQNLHSLVMPGDTGSGSGMTKIEYIDFTYILFGQPQVSIPSKTYSSSGRSLK